MNPGELRHRIVFQTLNEETEEWIDNYYSCFAKVNIAGGNEYFGGGTEQSTSSTIFTIRYTAKLKDLYLNTQLYRIKFRGATFDIKDIDNYMFLNESLKIKAVGRIER